MNYLKHSRSQAGQDAMVAAILGGKRNGLFVEIGASHPTELSNTFALESELGWRGIGIDISPDAIALCQAQRSKDSRFICADATAFDWKTVGLPDVTDFASVDVDQWTHEALKNLTRGNLFRFRVLTVEHDQYSRGDSLRTPNRDWLMSHGYEIIAADVHSQGCCFEDWGVAPDLVDMKVADRFRSNSLDWVEVLKLGKAI